MIPARATVITLGARDLDRLRRFYRGLGWNVAIDLEGFAALETEGAVVALFPLEDLAGDAEAPDLDPRLDLDEPRGAVDVEDTVEALEVQHRALGAGDVGEGVT